MRAELALAAALFAGGCARHDPAAELAVSDVETYWAIDPAVGGTSYLAPVVRFQVRNKAAETLGSVEARAHFWRKEAAAVDWGGAGAFVCTWRKPLAPGGTVPLVLKSDGRYTSAGPAGQIFQNSQFHDARVEVFLRIGSSHWVKFADADVERRIGTRFIEQAGVASRPPEPVRAPAK